MGSVRKSYQKKYSSDMMDDVANKCGKAGPLISQIVVKGGGAKGGGAKGGGAKGGGATSRKSSPEKKPPAKKDDNKKGGAAKKVRTF